MRDYMIVPLILIGILLIAFGVTIGGALESTNRPTNFAEGYCTALGGERLNDETCNVDGKVVEIR